MQANRAEFLRQLESVQCGLSQREIIEQSSCFVFKDKHVITFNDETACSIETNLKITGAVQAAPLLSILQKMPEEMIELEATESELLIKGKSRRAGVRMEKEILLPVETVDKPDEWKPLPEDFTDAVFIVQQCAGRDESQFALTCLNINKKYIEACDNYQLTRYKIKMPIKEPFLVRRDSIKHIVALEMSQFGETTNWVHFKNTAGLVISCRKYLEEYPDWSSLGLLDVKGTPATLPKGLASGADMAEIFSAENTDNNQIRVELKNGKIKLKGQGITGWYSEVKKINYEGEPLIFMIAPQLLIELVKRHNDCEITESRIKVDGGKFVYVSCLGQIEEKEEESE